MPTVTNHPLDGGEGPYTHGRWRVVTVTKDRKIFTDARNLVAHINEDGDTNLIGEYQAGFVEVFFSFHDLERLYRQALRQREKYQEDASE